MSYNIRTHTKPRSNRLTTQANTQDTRAMNQHARNTNHDTGYTFTHRLTPCLSRAGTVSTRHNRASDNKLYVNYRANSRDSMTYIADGGYYGYDRYEYAPTPARGCGGDVRCTPRHHGNHRRLCMVRGKYVGLGV